jgi:DNA-directed RNA polymerase subunit H
MTDEKKSEPINHFLVPKHEKLNKEEAGKVLSSFKASFDQLPKILIDDPAIKSLNPKTGDIIRITRNSSTAGESIFYRGVVNE